MDSDNSEIGDFGIYDVLTNTGVMRMKMNEGLKDHVVDVAAVVVEYSEGIQHCLPN